MEYILLFAVRTEGLVAAQFNMRFAGRKKTDQNSDISHVNASLVFFITRESCWSAPLPAMLLVYCKPLIGLGLIHTDNKGLLFYSKLSPRVSFEVASSPFIPGVYRDSDQLCSFKPAVKQVSAYLSYTHGRNLTRAHIAGLWHERGNPCCRNNPACMSFYSNRLLLGLTHIFKSHFQFITSSFASLWKVSNVTTGSSLSLWSSHFWEGLLIIYCVFMSCASSFCHHG